MAVITGAASGIGRGLAQALAQEGAQLVLADVNDGGLAELAQQLSDAGVSVLTQHTDVGRLDHLERLRDVALERFGGVDWLFNNAGILLAGHSWEIDAAAWERTLDVNLRSVIHATRVFVPVLLRQGRGHVINTASIGGLLTGPWMAPYAVTKHGVIALSEALYLELQAAGHPVQVSVLCPGPVDTGIAKDMRADPSSAAGQLARTLQHMLAHDGMSPLALARFALDGVAEGRFWLFPHPQAVKPLLMERAGRIVDEQPPRFPAV